MSTGVLLGALLASGCSPSGPRALLQGEQLIHEGKYDEAIQKLKIATAVLSRNAQAWNHLGLAFHSAHRYDEARTAYKRALELDRSLASTHFNLGCLCLELNDLAGAVPEFDSYTVLEPGSPQGWLKLGLVHVRLRQTGLAIAPLTMALKLQPALPEAWNALGTIALQKNKYAEAIDDFGSALKYQPNYAPALLNQAIVLHQYTKNHALALQKYHQYAALTPPPPNLSQVQELIGKLEQELAPPPSRYVLKSILPATPPATPSTLASNVTPPAVVKTVTNLPSPTISKPSAPDLETNAVATIEPPAPTKKLVSPPASIAVATPAPKKSVSHIPPAATSKPLVDYETPSAAVSLPKKDISRHPVPAAPPTAVAKEKEKAATPKEEAPMEVAEAPVTEKPKMDESVSPDSNEPAPANPPVTQPAATALAKLIPGGYPYRSPQKPPAGNQSKGDQMFREGSQLQQDGRWNEALAAYRKAVEVDPACFEAHYHLGLAAQAAGMLPQALLEYEYALAIDPQSANARYNFAIALQKANYPRDAARELEHLLTDHPGDSRAHLLLANLYDRPLNQKAAARAHYRKVLELDPQNSQAAIIRTWLAQHP